MSILSTTMCYPNPVAPTQGVFVQQRLRAIHRLMPLRVIAPVPWFPILFGLKFDPLCGIEDVPPAWHPPMFYLPGAFKSLDSRFYGRALARGLELCDAAPTPPCPPPEKGGGGRTRLIEAHFVWPDGVGAWRVARRLGVPFVCTLRGKLVSQIADRSKRAQIRAMLCDADALIAVSRSLADLADEVAGRRLGARVIPNGVDGRVFRHDPDDARASCRWTEDAKYVVSVGHLQALKGFDRLVEVWPEVRRRIGDVRLVLVGGPAGEPRFAARLRRLVDSAGLGTQSGGAPPIVTLTGRVEPKRVAAMLNAADLFVLASRSEGWCNAIVEALACGCPVAATDVGGNREILHDPAWGQVVRPDNREALVEGICGALARDWDREKIAAAGGQRDWQQVARECADVFQAVMK